MKPKIQLFHFTRIPGVMKINDIEKCKMYLPTRDHPIVYYFLTNYRYLEETRPIRHKTLVIFIPCNNCNEHKVDPENCEFILDSENRISGFSFVRKFNRKSGTYYMVKNDFLGNFMNIFKLAKNLISTILHRLTTNVRSCFTHQTGLRKTKKQHICLFFVLFPPKKYNLVLKIYMKKLQQ